MSKNILFNHIDSTWKQDTTHPKPSLYTLEEYVFHTNINY